MKCENNVYLALKTSQSQLFTLFSLLWQMQNPVLQMGETAITKSLVVIVQSPSRVRLCDPMDWSMPGLRLPHHLLKLMSIASEMPSNHLILWCSLLLPSIFLSIRVFSKELSVCIRWPKYWSFSFSLSPSNMNSEMISLIIDWFDLCPCCPRDFQESSPAPQFKGINSLPFCLLYSPTLTSIGDHWEDHSLDYTDLCR